MLVVDDDPGLQDVLDMALEDAGFVVQAALDGEAGWRAFRARPPDVVILDVNMPELDGFELCRRIRGESQVPVMMLTSRADELDQVVGLEIGADDYVSKPFSTRALVARLRALLRRARPGQDPRPPVAEVGPLRVDRVAHTITLGGRPVEAVTATEHRLLFALAARPGDVLDRDRIVDEVYGEGVVVAPRTIDTFVKRLRRKLRAVDPSFDNIETVRAVGYRYRP